MFYEHLRGKVEALLFAAGEPLSLEKIAGIIGIDEENAQRLLDLLTEDYAPAERGLCLLEAAGGYQLATKEEYYDDIRKLVAERELTLSHAALETLAIIAYKQPITRMEIEAIRGVKADGVINTLTGLELIQEVGRKETVGRPVLYGTTELFLTTCGLNSTADLPLVPEELFPEEEQ